MGYVVGASRGRNLTHVPLRQHTPWISFSADYPPSPARLRSKTTSLLRHPLPLSSSPSPAPRPDFLPSFSPLTWFHHPVPASASSLVSLTLFSLRLAYTLLHLRPAQPSQRLHRPRSGGGLGVPYLLWLLSYFGCPRCCLTSSSHPFVTLLPHSPCYLPCAYPAV